MDALIFEKTFLKFLTSTAKNLLYLLKILEHNIVIMKLKSITAIVAFSIAFGFSALVAGLFAEPNVIGEEISALLRQDIANGQEVDEVYRFTTSSFEKARAVDDYAVKMELLDDNDLPADFRVAWREHKQAWRTQANFLARISYLRNKMTAAEIAQITDKQGIQIDMTWLNVLRISQKHGAVIPSNAF